MENTLLTWYQALQLLALGPCLFMLFFLCLTTRSLSKSFVPVLYFISLACSFFLPLLDVLPVSPATRGALLMGQSLTPALSFLLIIQFVTGRMPTVLYWAILGVPLIGGSSIVYATLIVKGEVCIYEHLCTLPVTFTRLYNIFSASLTFLLTVVIYHRLVREESGTAYQRQHKYALVIALVVLNLALLSIDLAEIANYVTTDSAQLASTFVRIGFIYLVLTSVFRVFDRTIDIAYERVPSIRPQAPSARDLLLADQIRNVFAQDKLHRAMDLSREKLAFKFAVTEHQLSRVVNQCFDQNVNMLINQYRVEEAKERLAREDTAVTVIAFEVGFSSISSFNRVFKQMTDLSPSEYRAQQQEKK